MCILYRSLECSSITYLGNGLIFVPGVIAEFMYTTLEMPLLCPSSGGNLTLDSALSRSNVLELFSNPSSFFGIPFPEN
jgi:hypothetical protein